jgi:tRNA 2-selenouridine synthase
MLFFALYLAIFVFMFQYVDIRKFLDLGKKTPVADLRSPSEFSNGHIPEAVNIPLFNDEERTSVGKLYKKSGREEAIRKGFEILGAKYSKFTQELISLSREENLLLYCWRGGMRSATVGWLLKQYGINATVLTGGYKSYRKLIREFFSSNLNLRILGGMTGCGKTDIIKELNKSGSQVIDLESLANHKGSAFGSLGEEKQPSNEQFENILLFEFLKLDKGKVIWLENESQAIGKVFIPNELYLQMKKTELVNLEMPQDVRIERLVDEYSQFKNEHLIQCMEKIKKKIGGQHYKSAVDAIQNGNYKDSAAIALRYYDKTYSFGLKNRDKDMVINIRTSRKSPRENAKLILSQING